VKGKRQVYFHEVNEDTFDTYDETPTDYDPFDIDKPVETIQAYASNHHPTTNRSDNNNRV
jgi:hypothetical protein